MTMIDESRPIMPETPRIETQVTRLWHVTDVDSTDVKTHLDVLAIRCMTEEAFVHVDDRGPAGGSYRAILRLRPNEARRLAQALEVAAVEAEKFDRVTLGDADGTR